MDLNHNKIVHWLKETPLLQHKSKDDSFWQNQLEYKIHTLEKGAHLYEVGEPSGSIYIVYSGIVEIIYFKSPASYVEEKDFFGELELPYTGDDLTYSTFARAGDKLRSKPTIVVELAISTVRFLLENDSYFETLLLAKIQNRIREFHWFFRLVEARHAIERVACALLYIFDGHYPVIHDKSKTRSKPPQTEGIDQFSLPYSEIAALANVRPNYTHSQLKRLMTHHNAIFFTYLDENIYAITNIGKYQNDYTKGLNSLQQTKSALHRSRVVKYVIQEYVDIYDSQQFFQACEDLQYDLENQPPADLPTNMHTYFLVDRGKLVKIAEGSKYI